MNMLQIGNILHDSLISARKKAALNALCIVYFLSFLLTLHEPY